MGIGIRYDYPRIPLSARLKAFVANARPFTLLLPLLGGYFILQASLGFRFPTPDPLATGAAIFAMVLINAAGNYWNSYCDVEIDQVNKPYRALPAGLVRRGEVFAVSAALAAVAVVLSVVVVGGWFAVLALATVAVTWAYSFPPIRLKKRLWWNNVSQALTRGVLGPLAMWAVYGSLGAHAIYGLCAVAFVLILTGQSIKDIPDLAGDIRYEIRTIPAVYGVGRTYQMIAGGALLSGISLAAVTGFGLMSDVDSTRLVVIFAPVLVLFVYFTLRPRSTITENTLAWNLYYATLISLYLGFFLASIIS